MSFVKILAPLTGGPRDEAVLAGAVAAALPFGAHVAALFVRPDPALAVPFYGDGVSGTVVQEVMDASRDASDKAAELARATLDRLAKATDVAVTPGCEKHDAPTVSFKEALGNFADSVTRAARLSDLVVFSAPKEDERAGVTEAIEAALLEARRPVLLSARAIAPGFGETIVIGWNASVQSAQAVTAALPFLKRAKRVEILSVEEKDTPCAECGEIVEYLALHGIACETREVKAGGRAIADVLLESAAQSGAGLLVLGGYGHSRWRELFTGGITRYAITHADLPLFLVH
ncbi:MAG TPA: universal stress protein [Rhizomicrobium sp.]|nr:universal stress protein [Rhizomicrobium sp.]